MNSDDAAIQMIFLCLWVLGGLVIVGVIAYIRWLINDPHLNG